MGPTSTRPTTQGWTHRPSLAGKAFGWVVLAGLILMLGANLPGHLSFDSVVQLYEGRFDVRTTWAPFIVSWLLGRFDGLVPGPGLYVAASGGVLFGALAALRGLRPTTSWLAPVVAAAAILTPQLLIYQAIVWKDVLFANLCVAGFVALAWAARDWNRPGRRAAALGLALVLLAAATLVRQNGIVAAAAAAGAVGLIASQMTPKRRLLRGIAWTAGALAAVLLVGQGLNRLIEPSQDDSARSIGVGLRVLQQYDIVGAVAHDPATPLTVLDAQAPAVAAAVRADAAGMYSPERVDAFARRPATLKALWRSPAPAISGQWRDLILHHPGAWLAHRRDVFTWTLMTPDLGRCLPVHVGVGGPPDKLAALRMAESRSPRDDALARYAARFFPTPVYSHLTFALIAVGVAGLLALRRDPQDLAIAGLMLGALGFAATFALISIACDYRYLYVLDLSAMTGLIYLALDPRLPLRRRR